MKKIVMFFLRLKERIAMSIVWALIAKFKKGYLKNKVK